ncbi:MAG TPA: ligase-associated DNA damage response endonuclease PdeM, partial [Saprospiraceae bacterium]|nr:ligase-associated DNA damage response endonuclease PdeM [Saprospiraceae bacterium]
SWQKNHNFIPLKETIAERIDGILLEIAGEKLSIHLDKYLYFVDYNVLVISDLHFGKMDHFRKNGIAVPPGLDQNDNEKLATLLNIVRPDVCVFLGDLFHSDYNDAWNLFCSTLASFNHIRFVLTVGNHDILRKDCYSIASIELVDKLVVGSIVLSHESELVGPGQYNIHGHIHPGVVLRGKGRQHLKLPCFYFGKEKGVMPAFGKFTGLATMKKLEDDRIFAITAKALIEV